MEIKTASLYEMTEEWKGLLDDMAEWAEEHEGDVTDYPLERLDKLEGQIKDKSLRIAAFIKDLGAMEEVLAAEEKSLAKRKKAHKGRKERLWAYLEANVPKNAEWENARAALRWKKNPPSVEVLINEERLPPLFQKVKVEAAKANLKKAAKKVMVPVLDAAGLQVMGPDEKPLMREEMQVTAMLPTGDQVKVTRYHRETGEAEDVMEDVLAEKPVARLVSEMRLEIQ